jgi:hypothetical protein
VIRRACSATARNSAIPAASRVPCPTNSRPSAEPAPRADREFAASAFRSDDMRTSRGM